MKTMDGKECIILYDVPKSYAERYISLLNELKPSWDVRISTEDYNLYKLGFVSEIPCELKLNIAREQISELYDELICLLRKKKTILFCGILSMRKGLKI